MDVTIRIPDRDLRVFRWLRIQGEDGVERISSALKQVEPHNVHHEGITRALDAVPADLELKEHIARVLLNLYQLRHHYGWSSTELWEKLFSAIQQQSSALDWEESEIEGWKRLKDAFVAMVSVATVELAAKVVELTYEGGELLQRARVVTDIRPVFDQRESIATAIVFHTLCLRYTDAERSDSSTLALRLDHDDLVAMISQCERALRKEVEAQNMLNRASVKPVVLARDEEP